MPRVDLAEAAVEDMDRILEYVRGESPAAADRLCSCPLERIESLSEFPDRCPIAPESDQWGLTVRSLLVFSYRVLYVVRSDRVSVLRVVHGHRRRLHSLH